MTLSADPAGRSVEVKDRPCLVKKSLARSQSEYLVNGVTNTWNSQSLAWTLIVVLAWYASSAGFTKCVNCANSQKYVNAAIKQPNRLIFKRPIRSDRAPKTMKNGVPISSDSPIRVYAVSPSSFSVMVRKNST